MRVLENNKKTYLKCGLGLFSACLLTGICEAKDEKEQENQSIPGISSNVNSISAIADTIPGLMGQRSS